MPENNGEASGSIYVIGRSSRDEPNVRPGNGAPAVARVTGRDWPQELLKILALPAVTAFTYVIASAYQEGYADYFGIPGNFVTVDLRRSAVPITIGLLLGLLAMFLGALAYQGRTRWTHAAVFIWILYGVLTATLSARIGIIGISFAAAVYLSERYKKLAQGLAFLCVSVWVVVGWPWLPTFLKVEVPIILLALATMELSRKRMRRAILDGRIKSRWVSVLLRIEATRGRPVDFSSRTLRIQLVAVLLAGFFVASVVGCNKLGKWSASTVDTFLVLRQDSKTATIVVERYGDRVVTGIVDLSTKRMGDSWTLSTVSNSHPLEGRSVKIGPLAER